MCILKVEWMKEIDARVLSPTIVNAYKAANGI